MNSHTASISQGTYYDGEDRAGIGLTTLKAYCNDTDCFAIYAIGYTGEIHTKLVGIANSSDTIIPHHIM